MRFLFSLLLFCAIAPGFAQPVDLTKRSLAIVNVNVVAMDTELVSAKQTVIVKNGKIVALGKASDVKIPRNALVIDGAGKYLMPGLAEMHAHIPPVDDVQAMKEVASLFLLNGITTIRGMLGHPKHLELRGAIQRNEVLAPNFYTTGPSFNGMSVKSPEAGAEMVRNQKKAGYDFLKLHPGLSRMKFDSIAKTAHELNIPFVGHVSFGVGVWHAAASGYSSIDHLDGFIEGMVPDIGKMVEQQTGLFGMFVGDRADTTMIPKLIETLRSNKVWVVPTQALAERWMHPDYRAEEFLNDPNRLYMKPETVNQWVQVKKDLIANPQYDAAQIKRFVDLRRKLIKACQNGGVDLLLGCDAPQIFNVPGFSTHQELEYLVGAGLTPFQALQTGTVNVARYFKLNDTGAVKVGFRSDLLLIDGNPLENISNTKKISGIVRGNKWLSPEFIAAELARLKK